MVKIVIENLEQKEIIANDSRTPLLQLIHQAGVDWMTGCGGKGRCTTCKAIVVSGGENITAVTPAELRYRAMGALVSNERLTCQARLRDGVSPEPLAVEQALPRSEVRVTAVVRIRVPDEYKLPHMKYS